MKKKKIFLLVLILVLVDQLIKFTVLNTIAQTEKTINILNIFELTYLENTGIAFGLFGGNLLIIGLNIMIVAVVLNFLINKKYQFTNIMRIGLCLILSGGIGNLIDRIFRGYVIDYIDISMILEYPVFNFADMCIVVGVIIIMINILINTVRSQEKIDERV